MCMCIYIYVYVAGTFRYHMNISLPLWVGSLNFSPLVFFLRLLSLSLSLSLPPPLHLSLPPSLSNSLSCGFYLLVLLWTHDSLRLPAASILVFLVLFTPSPLLFYAILLSGCFGKNACPGPLCSPFLSSFVQVSLLESVSPLPFFPLLVPLVLPSASVFLSLLLLFSRGAFGTQESLWLPCVPLCVLEPIISYLLLLSRLSAH